MIHVLPPSVSIRAGLEPGVHYVPFSTKTGSTEQGNLLPRLMWLKEFDEVAKDIARRSESFGEACLSEESIDDFVYELLQQYAALQTGQPIKYKTVDISKCFDRKSCRNVIETCFRTKRKAKRRISRSNVA